MKSLGKKYRSSFGWTKSFVTCLAVTSDSKYIVSGSADYKIRIWNFFERKQKCAFKPLTSSINSVAVTSNNKYIISGSEDNTRKIWKFKQKTL